MTTSADGRAKYLAGVPMSARGALARAFAGKASPRAAIKAMCLDCSHFDRAEVADCRVALCPLWSYRPFVDARRPSKTAPLGAPCDETASAGIPGGAA